MRSDKKFIESFKFERNIKRNRRIGVKKWKEIIKHSKKIGIENLIFDGEGEPFLEFMKLKELISYAKGKFKNVIVYTNASFASNEKNVEKKMKLLKNAGLTHLFISCDKNPRYKFHQSFIPEENIFILSNITKTLHIPTSFACNILEGDNPKEIFMRLKKMTNRKLKLVFLNQTLLNEILYWPRKLKFIFQFLFNKREKNLIDIDYVRLNPRVEKRISMKDIWHYKPVEKYTLLRLYLFLKKLTSNLSTTCSDSIFITSDGVVLRCYSANL